MTQKWSLANSTASHPSVALSARDPTRYRSRFILLEYSVFDFGWNNNNVSSLYLFLTTHFYTAHCSSKKFAHVRDNRVYPKWNSNSVNSANSGNLINHWSMNCSQLQLCFAGAVVASQSLKQEMAYSNPFTVMTNIFVTEFPEFSENI